MIGYDLSGNGTPNTGILEREAVQEQQFLAWC